MRRPRNVGDLLAALAAPPESRQALLERVHAQLARAEADVKHALTWGWRPGSTAVRHLFGPVEPWKGLTFWLDAPGGGYHYKPSPTVFWWPAASSSRTQGVSKKLYAPRVKSAPALFSPSEGNY